MEKCGRPRRGKWVKGRAMAARRVGPKGSREGQPPAGVEQPQLKDARMADDTDNQPSFPGFEPENERKPTAIEQRREIYSALVGTTDEPDYLHSALTDVYLPLRDPGGLPIWTHENGGVTMRIKAGDYGVEGTPSYRRVGLPWGTRARLIIIYLMTEAVRNQKRCIEVGESMRNFMRRLGIGAGGREYAETGGQLERLAVADIRLIYPVAGGKRLRQIDSRLMDDIPLWAAGEAGDWNEEVMLSERFYESVMHMAVTLDENAIRTLQSNARDLDVYSWLASRLPRVPAGGQLIRWHAVQQQFCREIGAMREVRRTMRDSLARVLRLYPQAQAALDAEGREGIILRRADPPSPLLPPHKRLSRS
jgi:Plasmid encoded RepA protein